MDALIILLLFAVVGGWLFWRVSRVLRLPVSTKKYLTVAAIVVLGVLLLYATQQ